MVSVYMQSTEYNASRNIEIMINESAFFSVYILLNYHLAIEKVIQQFLTVNMKIQFKESTSFLLI